MNHVEMVAGALWGLVILALWFLVVVVPFLVFLGFVIYWNFQKGRGRQND